jgi:hypothetical protein
MNDDRRIDVTFDIGVPGFRFWDVVLKSAALSAGRSRRRSRIAAQVAGM